MTNQIKTRKVTATTSADSKTEHVRHEDLPHLFADLSGITSSTDEINILDGVTASAAELNLVDGSIAGTNVASKALVVGASKEVDTLITAALKLGAGSGTLVTAVATDLNLLAGMVAAAAQMQKVAKVALAALDTAGGAGVWQNPESGNVHINQILVDVTTIATAACQLDIGTTPTNATTLSDNLIDGLDVHSGTGLFAVADQTGANGLTRQTLATGKWVTSSMASGAAAGLAGSIYIFYTKR